MGAIPLEHDARMVFWMLRIATCRGRQAANDPWPPFAKRRQVEVTRHGPYTRVILIKRS